MDDVLLFPSLFKDPNLYSIQEAFIFMISPFLYENKVV